MITTVKKIESLYLSMREWIKNDFARVVFENEFEAIHREMEETTLSSEAGPITRQIIPLPMGQEAPHKLVAVSPFDGGKEIEYVRQDMDQDLQALRLYEFLRYCETIEETWAKAFREWVPTYLAKR